MNLFKRPRRQQQQAQNQMLAQVLPAFNTRPPVRGTKEFLMLWRSSPWIRAVVSKIAFAVSTTEWKAYSRKTSQLTEINNHLILSFLRTGGGSQSYTLPGRSCLELTQKHLDLTGESFWVLERNALGIPVGFVPLAPHWIMDIAKPGNEFYKINVPNGGWQGDIPAADIVYFKDVDPLHPYERGAGSAEALTDEINTDEFASKHISSFLANRARPDVVISAASKDSPLPQEAVERLATSWQNRFGGANNQGRPFVSSGPITVTPVTHDFSQLQLTDLRGFERDLIVSVFGIPPEKLGILMQSNKSTIDAADQFFAKDTVFPRLVLIRDTLNSQLCPQFDENLYLDFVSPIEEDREFALRVMQAAPYAFTQKDWRKLAGFEVPDDASQDLYFVPFNLMIRSSLKEDVIQDAGKKHQLNYIKTLSNTEIVSISEEVDAPQVKANVTKLIEAIRNELVLQLGEEMIKEIAEDLNFRVTSRISSFVFETTADKITKINNTTKNKVKSYLEQAITDGVAQEKLFEGIDEIFRDIARARMIAQTESTQIAGFAVNEAMKQAGVEEREWLTTRDGFERPSHASMDGQVRSLSEYFVSGNGNTTDQPGGFGIAEEDINCRCAVVARFPGQENRSKEESDLLWTKRDRSRQVAENKYFTSQMNMFTLQHVAVVAALERRLRA